MDWIDNTVTSTGDFIVDIFRAFDGYTKQSIELHYSMITGQFYDLAILITAFYILSVSLMLIKGKIAESQKEFLGSIFLLLFIVPFVFDSQLYMSTFVKPITNTVFDLAGALSTAGKSTDFLEPLRKIQDIFYTYLSYADFLEEQGSVTNIMFNVKLLAAIGILGFCLLGSGIVFFLMLLFNMFMVYIMFIIGGPCLFFLAFSKTRHIFYGWLRATMTFSLTVCLAALVLSIALFAMQGSVDELYRTRGTDIFTDTYFATVLVSILAWYALKKTGFVISFVVGGMESASHGLTAVAGGAVGGVVGIGLATAQKTATNVASIGGGMAGSALKGIGNGFGGSASAIYRKLRG